MNEKLREYDEKISEIINTLSRKVDLYEVITKVNDCTGLYIIIKMELFNHSIPPLHEEPNLCEIEMLQARKERVALLLQNMARGIRDEIENVFSKILTEKLKNLYKRTARIMILENEFYELTHLFSLIKRVL